MDLEIILSPGPAWAPGSQRLPWFRPPSHNPFPCALLPPASASHALILTTSFSLGILSHCAPATLFSTPLSNSAQAFERPFPTTCRVHTV
ncbi:hypothetical protein IE81DRAFT_48475 [Ceraceosorus guamensis]|uniref:Uncharacterized protein n=1 Tax=Ceraceosorus guamensis TaxID=1522189 RepID=A0A316VSI6_9BASI|nr:hypothetical protein IE81DRAFT_48475 [Ceraceosorus guamensis]PWN39151.1 hypothetical protein IE81DRAFT_48475 [Ceraceosorus guamensis]